MCISKTEALKFFELGFKRSSYADTVYPQDIFDYQNSTWVIGGRILPSGPFLCEEEIYKNGVWIPGVLDFMSWLEENDCNFTLSYTGTGYKLNVIDSYGVEYKSKGASSEFAFYNAITKILKKYGGNPVNKEIEVIEAEFIDKKDL